MNSLRRLYRDSLALLTDLYELTMAYGYWKLGLAEREVVFHVVFRHPPFNGGYTVACGLQQIVDLLQSLRFDTEDLEYLATIVGNDGRPIFDRAFLRHLGDLRFTCDLWAVPEGTVVFAQEPLVRVTGPLLAAQLLETAILNALNFQTLIATKAARVCLAARGEPVLEFGLRRAQGIDGGVAASRAAYIGGCAGTSNVLAGKLFGIPVKGTHAHSWVMVFADELAAFRAYAQAMPNNCVFLVDTYGTLEGVRHAVQVARELRAGGHEMVGIRLDSGDLAYLSQEARKILDEAGLRQAAIVGSGELDEHVIESLKDQQAAINVWGVGTRLATGHGEGALSGVYKLTAVTGEDGTRRPKVKISDQLDKATVPGVLQVRRFRDGGDFIADAIYDEDLGIADGCTIVDPTDLTRRKRVPPGTPHEDLLVPVFRRGELVYTPPSAAEARDRCRRQLEHLHPGIKRLLNPHRYPAGLEMRLHDLRTRLILETRENAGT